MLNKRQTLAQAGSKGLHGKQWTLLWGIKIRFEKYEVVEKFYGLQKYFFDG